MPAMSDSTVSFRDFAGAILQGNTAAASQFLVQLLEVDPATAEAATRHFQAQMTARSDFMMKAMGLRTAVTGGDQAATTTLLKECFGLDEARAQAASRALRCRYG